MLEWDYVYMHARMAVCSCEWMTSMVMWVTVLQTDFLCFPLCLCAFRRKFNIYFSLMWIWLTRWTAIWPLPLPPHILCHGSCMQKRLRSIWKIIWFDSLIVTNKMSNNLANESCQLNAFHFPIYARWPWHMNRPNITMTTTTTATTTRTTMMLVAVAAVATAITTTFTDATIPPPSAAAAAAAIPNGDCNWYPVMHFNAKSSSRVHFTELLYSELVRTASTFLFMWIIKLSKSKWITFQIFASNLHTIFADLFKLENCYNFPNKVLTEASTRLLAQAKAKAKRPHKRIHSATHNRKKEGRELKM